MNSSEHERKRDLQIKYNNYLNGSYSLLSSSVLKNVMHTCIMLLVEIQNEIMMET